MPQLAAHRPFAADRSFTLGEELRDRVLADRYAVARSGVFELTARGREALRSLQEGWAHLEADPYYGGKTPTCYRLRRYSDFRYDPAANRLTPLRHVPYYQSEGMNRYVGGKVRHFGDVLPETYENPLFLDLVACDFSLFPVEERWLRAPWTCQVHMIRIVVGPGESTPVTPEASTPTAIRSPAFTSCRGAASRAGKAPCTRATSSPSQRSPSKIRSIPCGSRTAI